MHEPAGVVEILVQIPQNTPYSVVPHPGKWNFFLSPKIWSTKYPPPPHTPPPNEKLRNFSWVRKYGPQNTPPPPKMKKFQNWMETSKLKSPRIPPSLKEKRGKGMWRLYQYPHQYHLVDLVVQSQDWFFTCVLHDWLVSTYVVCKRLSVWLEWFKFWFKFSRESLSGEWNVEPETPPPRK